MNWYAWGPEAFAAAKRLNKPVLLSAGYTACHWCHVMAHESFENAEIAAHMNELFVNIKLDREERPDLDTIYQQALALLDGYARRLSFSSEEKVAIARQIGLTLAKRFDARALAVMPPAMSICDISQPPKMSPLGLASAGMARVRIASSPFGSAS